MLFSELRLSQPVLRAIEQEGYTTPTPIQAEAIPHALEGRDIMGCAQTGTGKTAAFAIPVIERLMAMPVDKVSRGPRKARALILSPTRELASQIAESFDAYGRDSGLNYTVIYGGVSQFHQEKSLRRGVDVIIATPGRLIDLIQQRLVDLSEVKIFVLDECDRMLDMGFIQPIRQIASLTPPGRQTLFFSATMPNEIMKLAHSLLRDPIKVSVTPTAAAAPLIEQSVMMVQQNAKQGLLNHLMVGDTVERAVVFIRTKHGAERVGKKLARLGVKVATIHGNKSQPQRRRALDQFRAGQVRVLVATDVAARGLDVDDISHVINFDLPKEPEAYVHRIGRTGRAGQTGTAIAFCDSAERGLLRTIEKVMGKKVPVVATPEFTPEVFEPRDARDSDMEDRDERPRYNAPRSNSGPRGQGQGGGYGGNRHFANKSPAPRREGEFKKSYEAKPAQASGQQGGGQSGGQSGGPSGGQGGHNFAYNEAKAMPRGPRPAKYVEHGQGGGKGVRSFNANGGPTGGNNSGGQGGAPAQGPRKAPTARPAGQSWNQPSRRRPSAR